MSASANRLQATLFEPNGDTLWLTGCFKSNSCFFFRVHAPRTSGQTEPTFVASTGAGECHKDVLQLDKLAAELMIKRHLTEFERGKDDNFMSWTNPLLFAIVYAFWRARYSDPGRVNISILDASQFPPEAFMPVVPLLDAYHIAKDDNNKLDRKWFHEEYLTQGRLDIPQGAMETFTLKSLIDYGLFDLYPAFNKEECDRRIYKRVEILRYIRIFVPTPEKIRLAANIAEGCCSSNKCRYILFAGLLSLRCYSHGLQAMTETYSELRTKFGPITVDTVDYLEVVSDKVPEYKRHVKILQVFRDHEKQIRQTQKPSSRRVCICSTSAAAKAEIEFALYAFVDYTMEGDTCRKCGRLASSACLREGCFSWCNTHCATVSEKQKCPVREFRADCIDDTCIIITNVCVLRAKSLAYKERTSR